MEKLKERWGLTTNRQLVVILLVFAITWSTAAKLAAPVTTFLGITPQHEWYIYWPARILFLFPIYQILLILIGWIFGQFQFFWTFEKKMLTRLGLGKFFRD